MPPSVTPVQYSSHRFSRLLRGRGWRKVAEGPVAEVVESEVECGEVEIRKVRKTGTVDFVSQKGEIGQFWGTAEVAQVIVLLAAVDQFDALDRLKL
jgi:hypothetical protein